MNNRSAEERLKEVITLIKKLRDFGFSTESSGVIEFRKISNEFVKDGLRKEAKIKFEEYQNITLIVLLSSNKNVDCSITIKH